MSIPLKTGIVAATLFVKQLCRILVTYRPAINTVVHAAVVAGHITTFQEASLNTWLDGAQVACDVLRGVSGY